MWKAFFQGLRSIARAVLAVGVVMTGDAARSAQPLRIGYFSLPPHSEQPEESPAQAPVVRYARLVAGAMGAESVAVGNYPLPRLIRMLESGELDMALMLAKSPSRSQSLVFATKPLYVTRPVLIVPEKSSIRRVETVDDLLGYRIGIWSDGFLSPVLRDVRLQTERLSGAGVPERHMRMLAAGHLEAFYSADQCAALYALRVQKAAGVRQVYLPGGATPLYVVFSRSAAPQWMPAFQRASVQVHAQGGYAGLLGERCSTLLAQAEVDSGDELRFARMAAVSIGIGQDGE